MVVRIRLQRFGRHDRPFYRIVAADSRSPRDGRFIELVRTDGAVSKPAVTDRTARARCPPPSAPSQPASTCNREHAPSQNHHHHTQLGSYDPIASKDGIKEVRIKGDRIKYWLSVGAQPSERCVRCRLGRWLRVGASTIH